MLLSFPHRFYRKRSHSFFLLAPLEVKFIKEQEFLSERKYGGGKRERERKKEIFSNDSIATSVLFVSDNLTNAGETMSEQREKKKALTRIPRRELTTVRA